jgi:protein gp37
MENSKIEWTDHTFNPVVGCQSVSPGCMNCYADTLVRRYGGDFAARRRTSAALWRGPVKWNKAAAASGVRAKVFCASLADVFDNQWKPEWRADLWGLIRATPNLDWQLLTKRPQNIHKMLPADWGNGWQNVWLGATTEDQEQLSERAWHLAQIPAVIRFLSYEPALGPLDLRSVTNRWGTIWNALTGQVLHAASGPRETGGISWIICGGESGPNRRPMELDWARVVRDDCGHHGVAYFFKQVDKVQPIPPDLMVRQFPVPE